MTPDKLTFRRAIMKALMVSLNSIDKVKAFCNEIAKFDAEFDLISGRYVIDAKSIMGIFSLDIYSPLRLTINRCGENTEDILRDINEFMEY